jgi:D-3-phosphoglycerate dehydrogenase
MPLDIFISTTPFGVADPQSQCLLEDSGFTFQHNPYGRKMTSAEVAEHASKATVLIAGTEKLMPLIERSEKLRMISRVGIGLDGVPLDECRRRGIRVSWTPDAVTPAVAELAIGLMISVTRFVPGVDRGIRVGKWKRPAGKRIEESVIGLAGMGRIGYSVARLLVPFKPRLVLVSDRKDKSVEIASLKGLGLDVQAAPLKDLVEQSDILSLHLPNAPSTRQILNAELLSRMKPGSFLVNTARGELIDEAALEKVLIDGPLAGAALDAFHEEPYYGPLSRLDNVLATPHIGSCSIDCRTRMEGEAAAEAIRFLRGEPLVQEVPEDEYIYQRE